MPPTPPRSLTTAAALVMMAATLPRPAELDAQATTALPRSAHLPASARAMALGGAYAMSSGHADAVFHHPALLTRSSGFGLDWQRWGPASSATAASAAVAWFGGGVGIGLRSLQHSAFAGGTVLESSGHQDDLFRVGSVPVSERIATLAYARDLPWLELDLGVAVELVDERVETTQHTVTLFDVSLARSAGPLVVALTAHDIGEKPIVETGSEPARFSLGAGAYGEQVGPLDLGLAGHVGLDQEEELAYGAGVEVGYWPIQGRTFVARLGVQSVPDGSDASPFTTGFAFWGDDITLEWAFNPVSDVDESGTHRFGVRFR